jgi:hypothetical protein
VVALDGDHRHAGVPQELEAGEGVVHRLRVDVAPVEEVSRDEHEVHLVRQRVGRNHVVPAPEEILRALLDVVAPAAQVDVRHV